MLLSQVSQGGQLVTLESWFPDNLRERILIESRENILLSFTVCIPMTSIKAGQVSEYL